MLVLYCCISLVAAAPDTFPATDTAVVLGKRYQLASVGKNVMHFQSSSGNLLNQELAAYGFSIRQYGPQGIGTLSRRGADPSQIQILWNGLVLNNPMLGMTDLSLLQSDGSSQIQFTEGGSGSYYGSGSVGGTLSLQHHAPEKDGSSAQLSALAGSFGQIQTQGCYRLKNKNNYLIWDNHWMSVQNNFPYQFGDGEVIKMQLARREQLKTRISGGFKHRRWDIDLHTEWQKSDRGLGTSAGSTSSLGNQYDENLRSVIYANYHKGGVKWVQRLGLIQDKIIFQLPGNILPDSSRSQSAQYQQEWHFSIGKWNAVAGLDVTFLRAETKNYERAQKHFFPAQFLSFYRQNKRYRLAAASRWEWNEQIAVNSISAEYAAGKYFTFKTNVSSSFRRPTLNDLYWSQGGNMQLQPEKGGNAELGIYFLRNVNHLEFYISTTVWARYLNTPIVWLPENNVWTASNLNRGDYHGVQSSFTLRYKTSKALLEWIAGGEWCVSEMTGMNKTFHSLFVPEFTGSGSMKVHCNDWIFVASCQGQSSRYVSTDNLYKLSGFALFSCMLGKSVFISRFKTTLSAGADNIFNHVYQVMPGRPMPMRSLWMKLTMNLQSNKQ